MSKPEPRRRGSTLEWFSDQHAGRLFWFACVGGAYPAFRWRGHHEAPPLAVQEHSPQQLADTYDITANYHR